MPDHKQPLLRLPWRPARDADPDATRTLACVTCGDRIAQALADCGSLRCHDCREIPWAYPSAGRLAL